MTLKKCTCIYVIIAGLAVICLAVTNLDIMQGPDSMQTMTESITTAVPTTTFLPQAITKPEEIRDLFALDAQSIMPRTQAIIQEAEQALDELLAIPAAERTFANTMYALDSFTARISSWGALLHTLTMVSTEKDIRDMAQQAVLALEAFSIEKLSQNKELYHTVTAYHDTNFACEELTAEERYFVTETIKDFKRAGLELSDAIQEQVKAIKKELADASLIFQTTINTDQRSIKVPREALAGLTDAFIASLQKEGDLYILGTDTPTVTQVLEHVSVEATRKALKHEYVNRGYPSNSELLKKIIALRDKLAQLLGYESYAALEIEDSMAKTVPTVEQFLRDLAQRVEPKVATEMAELQADLPEGVTLTPSGQFKSWDLGYVKESYKKKHLQIDEREIAEYFPVEKTIPALLKIYEEFFNIQLSEVPLKGFWHSEVRLITMHKDGELKGYLLLDLHPRPFKYTHACEIDIYKARPGAPAVAVVLANFPKPTADAPGLLKHNDVVTFFHEFGHAIHDLLSATELVGFAGTNVKRDFVEMPSQMLEEWIWDPEMLKRVSSHYKTGEPLSDELIDRLRAVKNFNTGDFVQRQLSFAELSLRSFAAGADKDPHALKESINKKLRPYIAIDPDDHFEASFGHLTGYGARYYGYLWSKVFALDMFDYIKQFGLVNPEIGSRYADEILGKGGSVDPEILLTNFLGRKPNSNAFFRDLGI